MILSIDPKRCTGCVMCEVYCSLAHEGSVNPILARITIHQDENRQVIVPVTCIPCEDNPCLDACPETGAIHLNSAGVVVIDEQHCTGCSRCVRACRIGAIRLLRLPGRGKHGRAVALKCDQCGGDPWCVRVCPTQAISRVDEASGGQISFERIASELDILRTKTADKREKDNRHG